MNPATTLYVGDSYDNDVVGAFNGGWHSMWFNHRGRSLKPGIKPVYDVAIDNFEQLFGAVKFSLTFLIINLSLMLMTRTIQFLKWVSTTD